MNLSTSDSTLGRLGSGDKRWQQAARQGAPVVAPVEAEFHLGQRATARHCKLDGRVDAGHCGFEMADERVDSAELLVEHAGLAAIGGRAVVDRAHRGGSHRETTRPAGHDGQPQRPARGAKFFRGSLCERPRRQAGQMRSAVVGGLHLDYEADPVLRAAAGLAAAVLPAEIGVMPAARYGPPSPSC